jgi:CheY-like chemotaxis protein
VFFRRTQEAGEDANTPFTPKHARVLIVEDSRTDALLEGHALERYGIREWKAVETAEKALQVLDREVYSIALLDYNLPRMNGLALLQRIKQDHPSTRVILVTGAHDEQVAVTAMKLGADDYVVKDDFLTAGIMSSLQATLRSIEFTRKTRLAGTSSLESGIAEVETLLALEGWSHDEETTSAPGDLARWGDLLEPMKELVLASAEGPDPDKRYLEDRLIAAFINGGSSPRDIIRLHRAALQSIHRDATLSATTRAPACMPTLVLTRLLQRVMEDFQRLVSIAYYENKEAA